MLLNSLLLRISRLQLPAGGVSKYICEWMRLNNLIQHLGIGLCNEFLQVGMRNSICSLAWVLWTFSDILLVFIFICIVNLAAALPIPEDAVWVQAANREGHREYTWLNLFFSWRIRYLTCNICGECVPTFLFSISVLECSFFLSIWIYRLERRICPLAEVLWFSENTF